MKIDFFINFENGLSRSTSQEKGERISYRYDPEAKKKVPYIDHYRKSNVQSLRNQLILKMKKYRPAQPSDKPIKLEVYLYFNIKSPKKLWGKYKTTKPDCDNYVKEIKDVMTKCGFWKDDNQVVDLHVVKYYAEKGTIYIRMEELEDEHT